MNNTQQENRNSCKHSMSYHNASLAESFKSSAESLNSRKRRQDDIEREGVSAMDNQTSTASLTNRKFINVTNNNNGNFKRFRSKQHNNMNKELMNQERFKLNINRVLDLLSKEQLSHLLTKSIEMEPKLEQFLMEESELKFFQNNGIKFRLLEEKLVVQFNKLVSSIPFERGMEVHSNQGITDNSGILINDYSFEKIKTSYLDFLNLIYDYNEYALKYCSLNMEIWNLVEVSLRVLICLPKFENKLNNYYKNYLIEKLDNLIASVLIQQLLENDLEKSKNIETIISMNKLKLDKLIEALGADKLMNVKKFVDNLCGGGSIMKQKEAGDYSANARTSESSSSGLDYINRYLQQKQEPTNYFKEQLHLQDINQSTQLFGKNQNLGFHKSILITGVASADQNTVGGASHMTGSDKVQPSYQNNNTSSNATSEYGISHPGVYFT